MDCINVEQSLKTSDPETTSITSLEDSVTDILYDDSAADGVISNSEAANFSDADLLELSETHGKESVAKNMPWIEASDTGFRIYNPSVTIESKHKSGLNSSIPIGILGGASTALIGFDEIKYLNPNTMGFTMYGKPLHVKAGRSLKALAKSKPFIAMALLATAGTTASYYLGRADQNEQVDITVANNSQNLFNDHSSSIYADSDLVKAEQNGFANGSKSSNLDNSFKLNTVKHDFSSIDSSEVKDQSYPSLTEASFLQPAKLQPANNIRL